MKKLTFSFKKSSKYIFNVLFYLFIFNAYPSFSQPALQVEETEKIIEFISKYTAGVVPNPIDRYLNDYGFFPKEYLSPSAAASWDRFPILRKIETAYISAGKSGKTFLKYLCYDLSKDYDSALNDKTFREFVKAWKPAVNHKVNFKLVSYSIDNLPKPPPEIKDIIYKVSGYLDQGANGGQMGVLKWHLNIEDNHIYDILRSSGSTNEVLQKAFGVMKVPPPEIEQYSSVLEDLQRNYDAYGKPLPKSTNDLRIINEKNLIQGIQKKYIPTDNIRINGTKLNAFVKEIPVNATEVVVNDLNAISKIGKGNKNVSYYLKLSKPNKYPFSITKMFNELVNDVSKSPKKYATAAAVLIGLGVVVYEIYDYLDEDDEKNKVKEIDLSQISGVESSVLADYIYRSQVFQDTTLKDFLVLIYTSNKREEAEEKLIEAINVGFPNAKIGIFNCSNYYSVIADSFSTKKEAENFCEKAKKRYTDAYVIPKEPQISPCNKSSLKIKSN